MKKIIFSLMVLLLVGVGCGNAEDQVAEEVMDIQEEDVTEVSDTNEATTEGSEATTEEVAEDEETEEAVTEEATEDAEPEATEEATEEASDEEYQDYIDIALTDIDGNTVYLSDYEGKFIVLNFFGVWCHYCMEEMPDLEKVHAEYGGDDFVILLVNATTTEKIGKEGVIEWYNEGLEVDGQIIPITMPMAMDLDGSALEVYPVSGFPTSYFINKEGKVLGAIPGMLDEATLVSIIEQYNN